MDTSNYLGPKCSEKQHNPVVGQAGMGKSMYMKNHCKMDISHHVGACYIDFHESDAQEVAVHANLIEGANAACFGPEKSEIFPYDTTDLLAFDFKKAISEKHAIAISLSKPKLGRDEAIRIANIVLKNITKALNEMDQAEYFRIYLDECHDYEDKMLIRAIQEGSKKNVFFTFSFQYLDQISIALRDFILSESVPFCLNMFRVSQFDAKLLQEKVSKAINAEKLSILSIGKSLIFHLEERQ